MLIRFSCSLCKRNLKVGDKYAGNTLPCPACKALITVPIPAVPVAEPPIQKPCQNNPRSSFADIFDAVKKGTVEDVRYFIEENKVNVNMRKEGLGQTPLHLAALNNPNVEIIKYLVSKGANINAKNGHGFTPLYQVSIISYEECGGGKNVSTIENKAKIIKYFLEQGADIDAKD